MPKVTKHDGRLNWGSDSMGSKRKVAILTISFLFLNILTLAAASMTSVVKGSGASLVVTPSRGTGGTNANLVGSGFNPNVQVLVTFGDYSLGMYTSSEQGTIETTFLLPTGYPGTYPIYAKNGEYIYASTTFTVVQQTPSPSPTSSASVQPSVSGTPQQSQTPTPTYPGMSVYPIVTPVYSYSAGTPKPAEGAISPLIIGIIVVAIVAAVIPLTFFIRRRGGAELTYEEAKETPAAPAPTYSPRTPPSPTASRYGQARTYGQYPTRPGMPPRYNQPSAAPTRVCPRCRQTIRADYSVCPHCHKQLR
jgi:hypothetical protein